MNILTAMAPYDRWGINNVILTICNGVIMRWHTHWGRVTHICVSKLTIIGSDNGLSPDRRQAIIWTNAGILLIGPLGTNSSEISIEILTFSFKKIRLNVSSAKRRPFCLGLNVLMTENKRNHRHRGPVRTYVVYIICCRILHCMDFWCNAGEIKNDNWI